MTNKKTSFSDNNLSIELPIQSGIDANTVKNFMSESINWMKNYAEDTELRKLFTSGRTEKRSKKGLVQLVVPSEKKLKVKESQDKNISDKEKKKKLPDLENINSDFSQEENISSDEDIIKLKSQSKLKPSRKKIGKGKRISPERFITISKEIRNFHISIISLFYSEILMAVIYLHHRAFDVNDLFEHANKINELIAEKDYDLEGIQQLLKSFITNCKIYISRDLQAFTNDDEWINFSGLIKTLEENLNKDTIISSFYTIKNILQNRASKCGRISPLVIKKIEDIILFKHLDFEYPYGTSFIELFYRRIKMGYNTNLFNIIRKMSGKDINNSNFKTSHIRSKITNDIKQNLISGIYEADSRMKKTVKISQQFIKDLTDFIIEHLWEMSIAYFRYAAASTNYYSSTTIQLLAFRTVIYQSPINELIPISPNQEKIIEHIVLQWVKVPRRNVKKVKK